MAATRSRRLLLSAISLVAILPLAGCLWLIQAPNKYVFELGGVKEIRAWTLQQTEVGKIADGHHALLHLALRNADREALAAYIDVHRQLVEGWPGFRTETMSNGYVYGREALIKGTYEALAGATRSHALLMYKEAFLAIEPDPDSPFHRDWSHHKRLNVDPVTVLQEREQQ